MNTLDDLHTLVKLLAKFEFPVSPILEYAIKNKEDELMAAPQNAPMEATERRSPKKVKLKVKTEVRDDIKLTKKKPSVLRVYKADGTFVEDIKAATTMTQVVKEIGANKVYDLKIPMDSMHLVTIGGNPQYPTAQHDVGNGLYLNVHSNTLTKKRQLERIFKALNLSWKVEIVES